MAAEVKAAAFDADEATDYIRAGLARPTRSAPCAVKICMRPAKGRVMYQMNLIEYFLSHRESTEVSLLDMEPGDARRCARRLARLAKTIEIFSTSFLYTPPAELESMRETCVVVCGLPGTLEAEGAEGAEEAGCACLATKVEREALVRQLETLGGRVVNFSTVAGAARMRRDCDCLRQAIANLRDVHPLNRAIAFPRPEHPDERVEETHGQSLDFLFRMSILHSLFTVAECLASQLLGDGDLSDLRGVVAPDAPGMKKNMMRGFRQFGLDLPDAAARDFACQLACPAARFVEASGRFMERAWFHHGGGGRSAVSEAWTILDLLEHDEAFGMTASEAAFVRDRCLGRILDDLKLPVSTDNVVRYALDAVADALRAFVPGADLAAVYRRFGAAAGEDAELPCSKRRRSSADVDAGVDVGAGVGAGVDAGVGADVDVGADVEMEMAAAPDGLLAY